MRTSIIIGFVALAAVIGTALLAAFGQGVNERAHGRDSAPITIDPTGLSRKAGPLPLQVYDAI
jgi:hypothetical protein